MSPRVYFFMMVLSILSCSCRDNKRAYNVQESPNHEPELSELYSAPHADVLYSPSVRDTFRIFSALPKSYGSASVARYPLVILLDANAYFEPVLAELKLGTLTVGYPACIVVGIGYKDFHTMDSLRDRDYTFPMALPEDSFNISGGAARFKEFIDDELLPRLVSKFRIDHTKIVLLGHSLGGYFVLYYLLDSIDKKEFKITNFIAASPSLYYYHRYLLQQENKLHAATHGMPVVFYSSVGTLEQDSSQKENDFLDLASQLHAHHYPHSRIKMETYSNFDHMDAAMPGFMKGLAFVFEK